MKNLPSTLIIFGSLAVFFSFLILSLTFWPVLQNELFYLTYNQGNLNVQNSQGSLSGAVIVPVDDNFGIVIPKIGANSKVISDVDPFDSKKYQLALTSGVAHAKGTVYPGEVGNTFIFSHSSVNFYEASRYNSIFYLLYKLEEGDKIYLFYQGEKFKYQVKDKKIVNSTDVQYLNSLGPGKTLTLMTCWPPGTTYKRLLVTARLLEENP